LIEVLNRVVSNTVILTKDIAIAIAALSRKCIAILIAILSPKPVSGASFRGL